MRLNVMYIFKRCTQVYTYVKGYIPWTKTTVAAVMSVFTQAKANLEKVKAHQIKIAGAAKQATVDAEGALLQAQSARTGAEEEIKEAVAKQKAIDALLQ